MSVEVVRGILRQCRAERSAYLLLLILGDYANKNGEAWPSVGTLADRVKLSVRETQRLTAELMRLGDLEVVRGQRWNGGNLYRIACEGWREVQREREESARLKGPGIAGMADNRWSEADTYVRTSASGRRTSRVAVVTSASRWGVKVNTAY